MSSEITRRRALQLVAAGGAVFAIAGVATLLRNRDDDDAATAETPGTTAPRTDPLPDDPIARIGQRYLEQYPDEADTAELRSLIAVSGPAATALGPALVPVATADFVNGDVVIIDGWHLSRTEARAAALVALEGAG